MMTSSAAPYHRATRFHEQLALSGRVLIALILRESKTRFGRHKFGFLWALIEPIAYLSIFLTIRSLLREHIPFGQDLALFLVTGLLTFRMFMAITSRGNGAITSNLALIAYPPVKPLDVIAARVALEILTMYVIWIIFLVLLTQLVDGKVIVDHVKFAEAIGAVTYLGTSIAFFNGVISTLFPTYERIWSIVRFPMLLLSGVFYVPVNMPPAMRSFLEWNPVLHCVEWMRTAIYLTYEPILSPSYVLGVATLVMCTALLVERVYRYRLYN